MESPDREVLAARGMRLEHFHAISTCRTQLLSPHFFPALVLPIPVLNKGAITYTVFR